MNKKIIFISLLTLVALVFLYLYSFGPLANWRTARNFNPTSLLPTTASFVNGGSKNTVGKNETYNAYHNRDARENYYTISLPQSWQINAGKDPGSYAITAPNINAQIGLMDVPDNSTLELYILSQDEPGLKTSLSTYNRLDYQKKSINGNEAYELSYTWKNGNDIYQTVRTYIAGQDRAGLIVLSSKQSDWQNLQPILNSVINSFNWENK